MGISNGVWDWSGMGMVREGSLCDAEEGEEVSYCASIWNGMAGRVIWGGDELPT